MGYALKTRFFATVIVIVLMASFIFTSAVFARTFKEDQLRYPRVRKAIMQNEAHLKELFRDQGVNYPPKKIFIRIFKHEKVLELWAFSVKDDRFHKIKTYPICSSSGKLGPKRREGDYQVPEGFYDINRFNPASSFYLSLGINYPNASDRRLGVQGKLGGDIFIHGSCVTIGCVPITDNLIKELYLAAVEARNSGQKEIPVHIFPARLNDDNLSTLRDKYKDKPELISFWESLKPGYDFFENERRIPNMRVNGKGAYWLRSSPSTSQEHWKKLDKGLEMARFETPLKSPVCDYPITVLKIDPTLYEFRLISASEHGGSPKTAKAWAEQFDLAAAINASMYTQDHKTSTGLMRNYAHTNNNAVNPRFGAFMAFNPKDKTLPSVRIIDRYSENWKYLIKQYRTMIQNYRMTSPEGKNLWKPSEKN